MCISPSGMQALLASFTEKKASYFDGTIIDSQVKAHLFLMKDL